MEEAWGRVVRAWMRGEVIYHKPSDTDPINKTYLLWVSEGVFPASSSRRSLVAEENCGLRVPRAQSGKALHGAPSSLSQVLSSHPDPPKTRGPNLPGFPKPYNPLLAQVPTCPCDFSPADTAEQHPVDSGPWPSPTLGKRVPSRNQFPDPRQVGSQLDWGRACIDPGVLRGCMGRYY